jgi:hypothetical protein
MKELSREDHNTASFSPDDEANPCGYIARSLFNDTFRLDGYVADEEDIAWPDDIDNVYERASDWKKT